MFYMAPKWLYNLDMRTINIKDLKFKLPERKYCHGKKEMTSLRLHSDLKTELETIAEEYGWDTTDVIITALDQFVTWAKAQIRE